MLSEKTIRVGANSLSYRSYGSDDGIPIIYFHGFSSSANEAAVAEAAAREQGARIIAFDRPGYSASSNIDWMSFDAAVADVQAVLAQLGVQRCAIVGVSGGTPHALALAARLDTAVTRVLLVSALGPVHEPAVHAQFSRFARFGFWCAQRMPRFCRRVLRIGSIALRWVPRLVLRVLRLGLSAPDRNILRESETVSLLARSISAAARQGGVGIWRDLRSYAQPWNAPRLNVSVELWHGDCDRVVPLACAQRLAAHMPGATLRVFNDEGHFSLPLQRAHDIVRAASASYSNSH